MDEIKQYKSNSDRSRAEKETEKPEARKTGKVISGEARVRKKSGLSKAKSALIPGDMETLTNYILMDVLLPTAKRAISEIVCNGINILLGEPNRSRQGNQASKVSYRSYYESADRRDQPRPQARTAYSYDDVIFPSRGDAEEVLYRMEELVDRFGQVSVADLFDCAGLSCQYTDNKYGWTNLGDARVDRVSDGYIIRLPRANIL